MIGVNLVMKGAGGIHGEEWQGAIIPPSKKTDSQAGKALKKGSGIGGRVLADASAAKRQGVKRPGGK
jgi:hypothetical protein